MPDEIAAAEEIATLNRLQARAALEERIARALERQAATLERIAAVAPAYRRPPGRELVGKPVKAVKNQ